MNGIPECLVGAALRRGMSTVTGRCPLDAGRLRIRINHMVKSHRYDLDLVFHALADPTRRGILRDLTRRERTVSELARPYRMSLVGVSKHLKVLERARLIERRKDGSFHFMRLNPAALRSADEWLRHYERFWNDRLDALTHLLEQEEA